MTYLAAAGLQTALYSCLTGLAELEGIPVLDALPQNVPDTYVLIGAEEVRDASDSSGPGGIHQVVISIISAAAGFLQGKEIAGAICRQVPEARLDLSQGASVVSVAFSRAEARRIAAGRIRRIDLTFRIRVQG